MNGCFQFFFSSKQNDLPHADVPTRDVTNTCKMGNKTEPYFEKMMENWCPCRARFVTANVKKALQSGDGHCMILTTNHPRANEDLAVGVLCFSPPAYERAIARFQGRWNAKKYLPYVGSNKSKLVSFSDAFRLRHWMIENGKAHLPGKRYGVVKAEPRLLERILKHFEQAPNQIDAFLTNVRHLETILRKKDPDAWKDYSNRKEGVSYHASTCSVSAIRKAKC
jgi:hypothetical protein